MECNAENVLEAEHGVVAGKKLKEPDRYRVLLHNDNYTSMDFVVAILCRIFYKATEEATEIMLHVHQHGIGECGIYTEEVAEAKVRQVTIAARGAGFPLKCTMEKI